MSIQPPLIDRDLSILAFNARVLDWAAREEVPLLERLRYLSIVSSNLDEYFEVRMANLLDAAQEHRQEGHRSTATRTRTATRPWLQRNGDRQQA